VIDKTDWTLERAVFDTIRYGDIFAMPVTAVQIWRNLVVNRSGTPLRQCYGGQAGVRWSGHHVVSLKQVEEVLSNSDWLKSKVMGQWGYYCLISASGGGAKKYVRARLARHVIAQHKWRSLRRSVKWLAKLPLVTMVGVGGALAMSNTKASSDWGLFIVVKQGRIWLARLFCLVIAQLLGQRRKYWEGQAPDKICLNHYVTDGSLMMVPEVRNLYTAVLYNQLVPMVGWAQYEGWMLANGSWIKRWLMYPDAPALPGRHYVPRRGGWERMRRYIEQVLFEPLAQGLEGLAERVQRRAMAAHARPGRPGRVAVSDKELAFHPDTKVPAILHRFNEEYGQGKLL